LLVNGANFASPSEMIVGAFMNTPRDANSQELGRLVGALPAIAEAFKSSRFDTQGTRAVEAWFLGPKAENADEFERLIVEAIRDQAFWRRNYHPDDPTHITEEIKRSEQYVKAIGDLRDHYGDLLSFLKKSVPFFSMRYQGHMNWDLTIPGMLGYFAAMLYNPNNVAFEGSTATTILELLIGDDLCRMLGYSVPTRQEAEAGAVRSWGHITCDGTVANIEAIWAARNLKFYPLALKKAIVHALEVGGRVAVAAEFTVDTPSAGVAKLVDLSAWQLLNLPTDVALGLPVRLATEFAVPINELTEAVTPYSLQQLGFQEFSRTILGQHSRDAVVLVPGTKHYSFPKAAALLGLGAGNLIDISVDLDARLDMADLRARLDECLRTERPVVAVVAVVGTTEESAVDPVADVLAMRDEFLERGLSFTVHVDAAWGGYHRSVLNDPFSLTDPRPSPALVTGPPIALPLSDHSRRHLSAMGGADSITVDPHKSGYIPYPAGALCYRNGAMRNLVSFSAPVVFHGDAEPTVGIYGIEGSKPGAAAAAVYLSHRVIRPSREGYGKIIGQALFSCRKLYARLLTMAKPDDPFIVVPVPRQPSEQRGEGPEAIEAEKRLIGELIDGLTSDQIRANSTAMSLLQEIGPDQNILAYSVNLRLADGSVNPCLAKANALNETLYRRLSIDPGHDIYGYDLIVSTSDLHEDHYGPRFLGDFKRRLGVSCSDGGHVTVLRSVVMDPWVTDTSDGSFIEVLSRVFRKEILAAIASVGEPGDSVPERTSFAVQGTFVARPPRSMAGY
jgi:glutamate/tyrosine decarboxylase-like PLP-dependent enzyme